MLPRTPGTGHQTGRGRACTRGARADEGMASGVVLVRGTGMPCHFQGVRHSKESISSALIVPRPRARSVVKGGQGHRQGGAGGAPFPTLSLEHSRPISPGGTRKECGRLPHLVHPGTAFHAFRPCAGSCGRCQGVASSPPSPPLPHLVHPAPHPDATVSAHALWPGTVVRAKRRPGREGKPGRLLRRRPLLRQVEIR